MAHTPTPRIDGSQLAALVAETLLNGIFLALWVQCLGVLLERSKQRSEKIFKPLSVTAIFLFLSIVGHWLLSCARAFDAFIFAQDHATPSSPFPPAIVVYLNLAEPKSVASSALYVLTTLVGDAFMVYRLYIVWGRNWLIAIAPAAMVVGLAVSGGTTTYQFSKAIEGNVFGSAGAWITASFVMTLLANLSSTILITLRIWLTNRKLHCSSTGTTKVIEIVVESALLYSCCVLLSLCAYAAGSNIQSVGVAINGPMVGIIFCMIVSRAYRSSLYSSGGISLTPYEASTHRMPRKSRGSANNLYRMSPIRPMTVKITTDAGGPLQNQSTPKFTALASSFSAPLPSLAPGLGEHPV